MIFEPLDYTSLAANAPETEQCVNDQERLAQFFTDNMKNDALGRVAHLHVALCDFLADGACDPTALELAKSQSVAVDFPKTGIVPQVPQKALTIVRENGYPDFMQKSGKSYVSEKLLGQLFRRVDEIAINDFEISVEEWQKPKPDPILKFPGFEQYLAEAKEMYRSYCYDLTCLTNKFGLRHEEELFVARALHWHPLLKSDKGKAMAVRFVSISFLFRYPMLDISTCLLRLHTVKPLSTPPVAELSRSFYPPYDDSATFSLVKGLPPLTTHSKPPPTYVAESSCSFDPP